ncbi:hypothetical protein M513_13640, partial [Trichuris suis]
LTGLLCFTRSNSLVTLDVRFCCTSALILSLTECVNLLSNKRSYWMFPMLRTDILEIANGKREIAAIGASQHAGELALRSSHARESNREISRQRNVVSVV